MEKRLDGYMFKGTRVPVSLLLSSLKEGTPINEFLEDFSTVKRDDVDRVLDMLINQMKNEHFNGEVKGEVLHKGNIVPVEVEINKSWLGLPGVIIHVPNSYEYKDDFDLIPMVDFRRDLDDDARANNGEIL